MRRFLSLAVVVSAVSGAGCTSVQLPAPTGPEGNRTSNDSTLPGNSNAPSATAEQPSTSSTLLAQARDARLAGRLGDAEDLLEAALRIEPNDARLWLELAEVQFAAGEFDTARGLAERALTLAAGDENLIEAAQRLRLQTSN